VEHPYLGFCRLTPEIKQNINSDPNSGLSVDEDRGAHRRRHAHFPAAASGLELGMSLQANGQLVIDADTVQQTVENSSVGGNCNWSAATVKSHPAVRP